MNDKLETATFAVRKLVELAPGITRCVEHLNDVVDSAGINLSRRVSKIGHLLNKVAELQSTECQKVYALKFLC